MKKNKIEDRRVGIVASENNSKSRIDAARINLKGMIIKTIGMIIVALIPLCFFYVYNQGIPKPLSPEFTELKKINSPDVINKTVRCEIEYKQEPTDEKRFKFSGLIQHSDLQTGIADAIVYVGSQKVTCDKDGWFECELSQNNFHEVQDVVVLKNGFSKKKIKYTLSEKPITINLSKTESYEK